MNTPKKRSNTMKKIKYYIRGIGCSSCALEIEHSLSQDSNIKKATIDFANGTMSIVYSQEEYSISKLTELIKKVENTEIEIVKQNPAKRDNKATVFDTKMRLLIIKVAISTILLIGAVLFEHFLTGDKFTWQWGIHFSIYLLAYLLMAYDYIWKVLKNARRWQTLFDENTLMIIASLGAFIIGQYMEAVLVILLAHVGNIFEAISLSSSYNLLIGAIDKRSKTVSLLKNDNSIELIDAKNLKIGEVIVIKVGEVVPVDGVVIEGAGSLDTSSVTGEFIPLDAKEKTKIYSGFVLKSGFLKLKATSKFDNSTTAKILNMVVDSKEHKAKAENFITKFARLYTPIVVVIAIIIAIFPFLIISLVNGSWVTDIWKDYLYAALTFLVVACPCAIVISVPLAYFSGIALASKNGIIIKGANYLDRLNEVKVLVIDKTGTLTTGEFSVTEIQPSGITLEQFKEFVLAAEYYSTHPLAVAIKKNLKDTILDGKIENYEEKIGSGITLIYKGHQLVFGNLKIVKKYLVEGKDRKENITTLHLLVDNKYAGFLTMDDTTKDNAKKTIDVLKELDVKTMVLTGGNKKSAEVFANVMGIKEYHAELSPNEKVEYLKDEITSRRGAVAFMGDGVNDAPSIILADVGVAMGALGSDSAVENADVVLLNDDPYKFVDAIKIAKMTRKRAIACIKTALFIKISIMVITLVLAILNIAFNMMFLAVLADTGLTVLLVIYAFLLIKKKIR